MGPAQHTLSVTSDPEQGTGPFLDIDAITVYSATGSNGAVGGNGNNNQGGGGAPPSSGPYVTAFWNDSRRDFLNDILTGHQLLLQGRQSEPMARLSPLH